MARWPRSVGKYGQLLALFVGWTGCRAASETEWTADEEARALAVGAVAADALAGTLSQRLRAALNQGGPAQAIVFCSGRAAYLADSVSASLGEGIRVDRVTLRPRNPAHAPDPLDRAVLEDWGGRQAEGAGPPAPEVRGGPPGELRYYRPLVTAELCLGCHGPSETLNADVRELLSARYPGDLATGYRVGDLRGAIRVRIPRAALELP